MEGFFNKVDAMAEAIASASTAATQKAPAETLILPSEPGSVEEGT